MVGLSIKVALIVWAIGAVISFAVAGLLFCVRKYIDHVNKKPAA